MNYTIENYRIGHSIKRYEITENSGSASHWGLTDLYPDSEANLRKLIESDEDFTTEWCASKKELESAKYERIEGTFQVSVYRFMDDLWEGNDLIGDALWDVTHDESIELTEEHIDYILDIATEIGIDDSVTLSAEVEDPTYENVMDAVSKLEDETDRVLKEYYEELKVIVKDALTLMPNEKEEG